MPLKIRDIKFEDVTLDLVGKSYFKTKVEFSTR